MTREEIIGYVMNTPQNTNPAILSQKIDEYVAENGGSGSGGDSDFIKANIRFARATTSGISSRLMFTDEEGSCVGFRIFEEDGVRYISSDSVEEFVDIDQEYAQVVAYIMSGEYLSAMAGGRGTIESVSGDAELVDVVLPGESQPVKAAKIYGDCTIVIQSDDK